MISNERNCYPFTVRLECTQVIFSNWNYCNIRNFSSWSTTSCNNIDPGKMFQVINKSWVDKFISLIKVCSCTHRASIVSLITKLRQYFRSFPKKLNVPAGSELLYRANQVCCLRINTKCSGANSPHHIRNSERRGWGGGLQGQTKTSAWSLSPQKPANRRSHPMWQENAPAWIRME